ncbi:hypothetical protein [Bifidobacterium breve]|uniref:hypothetical protein n=1 Tax=Bifidobacterium breve TaxID=1685 RepID=UPI000E39FA50|nr:hypothetical protein [Bifidobacterium breve]RDX29109.1 hypothetical protein CE167_11260 [Bifidobacterium breve]
MEEKNIASRPPVEPSGAAGAAEKPASKPKWPIPAIAAGAVVVLVAAGFAGWHAYTARELDAAKTACAEAADTLRGKANDYNALVNGDAKTASETTPKQVRDAKAVDALKAALKATAPEYEGCTADSKDGLDAAAAKLGQQAEWYESHEKTLTGAVKAVETSKLDKTVDDANALLKSSDGQVQDDKTRDALSGAIKARDADAIAKAVKQVNDSVAAKKKADEEARAQAEAAAQAAAAQAAQSQASGGYTGGYSGYTGYTGGGRGGSNGGGQPAYTPPAAPQPTPAPSGGDDEYETISWCGTLGSDPARC